MNEAVLIYSTASSREEAERLADALVSQRMAACVNCIEGVRSVYRWQGEIERAQEVAMFIKTTRSKVPLVKQCVAQEHSYSNPALLVLEVSDALPDYLGWILRETL